MPIYEYACTKCDHEFELEQSIHDKPRSRCPKCRSKVRKVIGGGIGISFKGSGFYVTDSRPAKAGADKKASESSSKESGT